MLCERGSRAESSASILAPWTIGTLWGWDNDLLLGLSARTAQLRLLLG